MREFININKIIKKNEGKILLPIIIIILLFAIIGSMVEPTQNEVSINNNEEIIIGESVEKIEQPEEKDVIVSNEIIDNKEEKNEEEHVSIQNEKEEIKEEPIKEEKINLEKIRDAELKKIPSYSNSPYVVINNNKPFFYETDLVTTSYEKYGNLDSLRKMY